MKTIFDNIPDFVQWKTAAQSYYTGVPVMGDAEFDLLEQKLKDSSPLIKQYIESRIFIAEMGFVEGEHCEMISLKKITPRDWLKKGIWNLVQKFLAPNRKYFWMYKYDGAALKVTYRDQKPVTIITRGGMDVTKYLKSHPEIVENGRKNLQQICGEFLIKKTVFLDVFADRYENARNMMNTAFSDSLTEQERNLFTFKPYSDGKNMHGGEWQELETFSDQFFIDEYTKTQQDDFPYLCDGIVVSYIETGERKIKDNYPLNMCAIKFPIDTVQTKVTGFYYTQKKTNVLTPMVTLEPVQYRGVTVTKASGYNYQYLADRGIGIGSTVEITKGGDITPTIFSCVEPCGEITMPDIEYIQNGINLVAVDDTDSVQYRFVAGLLLLGIDGIGDKTAEIAGSICNYDILEVFDPQHAPQIRNSLGNDKWDKFKEIYEIRKLRLETIIEMLQLERVGKTTAKRAAEYFTNVCTDTKGMETYVIDYLLNGEGKNIVGNAVASLAKLGIEMLVPSTSEDSFTYEMTGNPPNMTKNMFKKELSKFAQNAAHTTLTKSTDILFCDDVNSSTGKANKARKYGIKIVSYADALQGKF